MVIELLHRICHPMPILQDCVLLYTLPYPIKRISPGT